MENAVVEGKEIIFILSYLFQFIYAALFIQNRQPDFLRQM